MTCRALACRVIRPRGALAARIWAQLSITWPPKNTIFHGPAVLIIGAKHVFSGVVLSEMTRRALVSSILYISNTVTRAFVLGSVLEGVFDFFKNIALARATARFLDLDCFFLIVFNKQNIVFDHCSNGFLPDSKCAPTFFPVGARFFLWHRDLIFF